MTADNAVSSLPSPSATTGRRSLFTIEPNPVLLFELRQIVRNRTILGMMALYLCVMVLLLTGALLEPTRLGQFIRSLSFVPSGGDTPSVQFVIGVFWMYYIFTTAAMIGFGALRTAHDRVNESPMFYSTLSPWSIVWGKFLFGIVFSGLFLSMTLPFLSVAFLMRGVDVRSFLWGAAVLFMMTQLQYYLAVAFLAGSKSTVRAVVFSLPLLLVEFILTFYTLLAVPAAIIYLPTLSGWVQAGILLTLFGIVFFMLTIPAYLLTTVQFSPETSNRMLPIRLYVTVFPVLLGLVICAVKIWCFLTSTNFEDTFSPLVVAGYIFLWTAPYLFLVFICEREKLSPRIRRQIPKNRWLRRLAFLFYTGAAGAVLWCFAFIILLFVFQLTNLDWLGTAFFNLDGWQVRRMVAYFSSLLLFWNYCATTLLLYNVLFHRWLSRQWNWLPLFVLLTVMFLLSFMMHWIGRVLGLSSSVDMDNWIFMPFPWSTDKWGWLGVQMLINMFWTIVLFLIGRRWLKRHWILFRPMRQRRAAIPQTENHGPEIVV